MMNSMHIDLFSQLYGYFRHLELSIPAIFQGKLKKFSFMAFYCTSWLKKCIANWALFSIERQCSCSFIKFVTSVLPDFIFHAKKFSFSPFSKDYVPI